MNIFYCLDVSLFITYMRHNLDLRMLCQKVFLALVSAGLSASSTVDLGYRQYRGERLSNGLTQWLGIQYAAPPVSELRFAAPVDPPYVEGIEDANEVCTNNESAGIRPLHKTLMV